MKPAPATFVDIVLSHAAADESLAEAVAGKLSDAGLSVYRVSALDMQNGAGDGTEAAEQLRQTLWESAALVVLLTPAYVQSPALTVQLGAAWASRKPVVLLIDPDGATPPVHLRRHTTYSLTHLPDAIHELRQLCQPLSPEPAELLAAAYRETGVRLDDLLGDAEAAARLVQAFQEAGGPDLPSERLLRELMRLRKRGQLPRLPRRKTLSR